MTVTIIPAEGRHKKIVVIGFGATGQSVMRFFKDSTTELIAMDTRPLAPNKKELQARFPDARLVTGGLDEHSLRTADMVVVSPGVSIEQLKLTERVGAQTQIVGDVEVFLQRRKAPVIAITGSNGKSTVATLTSDLLAAAGKNVLLGGNIGVPALNLLSEEKPDVYVLELSSFQLESISSLKADVAVVLNLCEDHLDRYNSYDDYIQTKATIYDHAVKSVINRGDNQLQIEGAENCYSFGLDEPAGERNFGVRYVTGSPWLMHGDIKLINTDSLTVLGRQNWENILASFALVSAFGVTINDDMIDAARDFKGLINRCEHIGVKDGVTWVNDSKGTNVGATCAAIAGFDRPKIVILGGQSKGADFTPLKQELSKDVKAVILIGEDADIIERAIEGLVEIHRALELRDAVNIADELSSDGDVVLLSPACASYDMFDNYEVRGQAFRQLVQEKLNG